jgi:hypothetical protein
VLQKSFEKYVHWVEENYDAIMKMNDNLTTKKKSNQELKMLFKINENKDILMEKKNSSSVKV